LVQEATNGLALRSLFAEIVHPTILKEVGDFDSPWNPQELPAPGAKMILR
jgi:hypothetical protein